MVRGEKRITLFSLSFKETQSIGTLSKKKKIKIIIFHDQIKLRHTKHLKVRSVNFVPQNCGTKYIYIHQNSIRPIATL